MSEITATYLEAMQAFNDFFEMLYYVMCEVLLEAKLSKTGAFVWRGYRIDEYRELAKRQYYCLVYPNSPEILIFEESYKDVQKSGDERYQYPFRLYLNLSKCSFFVLDKVEQKELLAGFIRFAAQAALTWQQSEGRRAVVPSEFLHGFETPRNPREPAVRINQVPSAYVKSLPLQTQLLEMLAAAIKEVIPELPQPFSQGVDLRPNAQWRNWHFRGYRMKILTVDGSRPAGPTPYLWRIYHEHPSTISVLGYDGEVTDEIERFDLKKGSFFDAEKSEQFEMIKSFVGRVLLQEVRDSL